MAKTSNSQENVLKKIPESLYHSLGGLENENYSAVHFLSKRLPLREIDKIKHELLKKFPLAKERQVYKKRVKRQGCPRKQQLSNTKKRILGLYNISRRGLLFKDLLPLHHLWKQYIENFLDLPHFECSTDEIAQQMLKADFHGAFMEVHKSCCPNLVGISGIVVFETRNLIKLLGEDNITRSVPKKTSEFRMKVLEYIITFLGKNLLIRAADRSIKKIRNVKYVEL